MQFKLPKDDKKYHWTQHVIRKMMHYGLSADRVKRVIRAPKRMEKGIAEGTLAAMSPYGRSPAGRQHKSEIWVMWAEPRSRSDRGSSTKSGRKTVITAWRYPGVSPVREEIPIPTDILAELKREGLLK